MGCGSLLSAASAPALPAPEKGQAHKFFLKKPMMGSGINVLNAEKEKWLSIKSGEDWDEEAPEMSIVTRDSEPATLATMIFEKYDNTVDEDDSDDSDYSDDDLFAFEDGEENKAKIRIRCRRKAKLMDAEGNEVGSVSWKAKAKGRGVSELQQATAGDVEEDGVSVTVGTWFLTVDTKIKKVFYKINYRGQDLNMEVAPNGKWWVEEGKAGGAINLGEDQGPQGEWEHLWKCDLFEYRYWAKFGTDEVSVDLPAGESPPGELVLLGHALSTFMHPCQKKIAEMVNRCGVHGAKEKGLKS